ncbi:PREDICTED: phosphatidylinositol phosphatase PTPRQ-like [Amphimedon queenslandica]|uniref:Protein-tyrosine-phosphatase n=1 Tax=Amphimedon queenslandica TaxID=400682 RepID=A0AAN0IVZ2_AMPQE|nr:PREDICTED: phosphatidylinositol phosphatase PTPRQ-like [Amphimedon queenslandica]|eukprot:XP_019848636.1 PREDICTED: phosphatidylinositol phosphatase PTPRQ-like [Amphimedon queenslandica]
MAYSSTVNGSVDFTTVEGTNGSAIVVASIAKISRTSIFTDNDQQMLRRIAYAETKDGNDLRTYSSNENGGIWRVGESKYAATKDTSSNRHLEPKIQAISTTFGIEWLSTNWTDLRKPFYSALAARLYMLVITQSIPLASNINGQGSYWANYFTSSGGTQSDYVTAVNELLILQNCSVNALDLYFVMDASGSVGSSNFQLMKNFVYNIANSFNVGSDSVRVGVMSFASSNSYHFHLNTYTTKSSVLTAINNLPYSGGYTYTGQALDGMRTRGFSTSNGARPSSQGVPRVGIVITDGQSTNPSATLTAATNVHNAGIIVFAIGIAGANQNELNAIASQPSYVSFISSFSLALLNSLQYTISQESCVASPDVNLGETISDNIGSGETKYLNYPLPNNDQGITIVLNVTNGSATLYASTVVSTPNEAFHDVQITTDRYEDVYIDPANLTNPSSADTVYIAIEGTSNSGSNQVQVSATQGDTSTDPVAIEKFTKTNFSKNFGATITVVCRASGKPLPALIWNKGGVPITASNVYATNTIISNTTIQSVITITNINFDNEGIYQCIGTNTLPGGLTSYSKSFTLTVIGLIVTNFTGIPISSTSIYLSWALPAGYTPQYYLVNVNELETNHSWTFHAVESWANIISLHPYYTYGCSVAVVLNETSPYSKYIFVTTHQSVPTGVIQFPVLNPTSSSELNVTWMAPPLNQQNGIISYYIVVITEKATNITYHNTTNLTWFYYFNLHPYYEYSIDIAAVTIDIGPFLTGINVTMPESAPSSSPIDVHAANISSYSVNISWLPPPANRQNGIIRWYEILIYDPESEIFDLTVSTTYAVITGLSPYCNYIVSVSAYTVSNGPYSEWITVTTSEDAPSAPPDDLNATVTSPYSALLTWDPPPNDQMNGVIISYVINVVILETRENFTLYSNTTSLFVDGLRPFRTFECIIAAVTNVGVGPYSAIFTLSTPQDAPSSSPVQVRSMSVTSRSFSLYWDPPSYDDQNGVINYYIIRIIEVETDVTSEYTSYTTVISLSSLHPAYTYYCSIAAYTVALGPFSIQFNITTDEDVPTQSPVNFVGSVLSSSSVSLSWNPPPAESQNGIIISYHINLTTLATGSVSLYTSYDTALQVKGLVPYTTYTCLIAAETSIGRGPYTTIISFTTMEDAPTSSPVISSHSIIDSHSVAIHWSPPSINHHNGIIRNYIVHIVEMSGSRNAVRVYNTTATTVVIGSLIPSYAYKFFIAASTVAIGPYTSVVITLPEDIPSGYPKELAVNDTTSDSFTLTWNSLPYEEQSGDIIGYVVNVTHADTLSTVQYYTILTSIVITGLDPYTTYVCVVAAETSVGVGPFSHLFFIQTDEHYNISITEVETGIVTHFTTTSVSYTLTDLHPFYTYKCTIVAVTIGAGPVTSLTVQMPEDVPSTAPNNVLNTEVTSKSLTINWEALRLEDQNGLIRHYIINVTETDTGSQFQYTSTTIGITLTDLHPYYTYSISVSAFTIAAGPWSDPIIIITAQDVPSSPPIDIITSSITSTAATIHWSPPSPSERNGIIVGYNITIEDSLSDIGQDVLYSLRPILTINFLEPYTVYQYSIAAVTTVGQGPYSTFLSFQTNEAAPSEAPESLSVVYITSTTVTLTWDPPPFDSHNGVIRQYTVRLTGSDDQFLYNATKNSITISDLLPYTDYEISVSAYTVANGPFTRYLSVTSDEAVPSTSPSIVSVTAINSSTLSLSWNPLASSDANGIVREYIVDVFVQDLSEHYQYSTVNTSLILTELHPYYTYTVYIAAVTIGRGPFSSGSSIRMPQNAPSGSPSNVTGLPLNSTAIQVSWDPPHLHLQNGIIKSYTIILLELRTNTSQLLSQNSLYTTVIIGGLHPYYDYRISVAAYTVGVGPTSITTIRTLQDVPSVSPQSLRVNILSSTTVKIVWLPPQPTQQNGLISHYTVVLYAKETKETLQYNTTQSSIELSSLHPFYNYTCHVATVTIGPGPKRSISFQMQEDVPQGPPQNLTVTTLNQSTILIGWSPPVISLQNGIVRSYTIYIFHNLTRSTNSYTVSNTTTHIVTDLKPFSVYSISVAASTIGIGPFTLLIPVMLPEGIPSLAPSQFVAEFVSNGTALYFSWIQLPIDDINGILLGYQLSCSGQNEHAFSDIITGTSAYAYDVNKNTHYTCQVCAFTSVGCGPTAVTYISTYENSPIGPPHSLSANSTSTTIHLYWKAPLDPDSVILNYVVSYYLLSTSFTIETPRPSVSIAGINETSYLISSLLVSSTYQIEVFAVTKEGSTLPTSEPINVTTSSSDSNSPKNFTCLAKSATSLKCTWLPPENLNYYVESYNISYRLAEGFDYYPGYGKALGTVNLHSPALEYGITGLQPYGGYIVELEAFLLPTIGSGYSGSQPFALDEIKGAVTTIAVTNPETPSAAVENIYITVIISNVINVSWKPPKRRDWNGRIDFYKLILTLHDDVDLKKRAEPATREILVKPTSNHPDPSLAKEPLQPESSLIEGLEENFEYSLTIVISNAAGNGIVSEPTTQKMPQAAPSGPPVNVTLKSVTTNTFNITWLPPNPLDANGVITGYHVIFNRTRINDISSYMLTASHNYFLKKGLHSYEMVSFKVAAKTDVGFGPFSSEYFFQTNEEIPNPPLFLRASLFNVSSVLLKWESIRNEPVIEYEVFYTGYSRMASHTNGPHQSVVLYSKIPQIVIVNLMSGYLYQFKVRTRNNAGVSGNSSVLITIPGFETSPTHVGEVSGASDGFSTFMFYIPIAFALLIFVVCTIIIIVIMVFLKKNRSKRKQKFEPSMTSNPLDLPLSGDDIQPEPTNPVEETNLNSMSLNESVNCENIGSNATDDPTSIDHA